MTNRKMTWQAMDRSLLIDHRIKKRRCKKCHPCDHGVRDSQSSCSSNVKLLGYA